MSYRSFSFLLVSMYEDLAEAVNHHKLMHVFGACVSGFSAAAAADRGQDVVWTSGFWTRCQTTARCWSSSLWSERSYIHRYTGPNWPTLKSNISAQLGSKALFLFLDYCYIGNIFLNKDNKQANIIERKSKKITTHF